MTRSTRMFWQQYRTSAWKGPQKNVEVWIDLRNTLGSSRVRCVVDAFNHRYNQAVTDAHLLANVLHPKYKGKNLNGEELSRAMALTSEFPGLMPITMKFQAKSAPFHEAKFAQSQRSFSLLHPTNGGNRTPLGSKMENSSQCTAFCALLHHPRFM